MGLMDFFKKGREEEIEKKPSSDFWQQDNTIAEKDERIHVVRKGESLSVIARDYYGNASLWTKIHEANKEQIDDPNMIFPGQEIIIPDIKK